MTFSTTFIISRTNNQKLPEESAKSFSSREFFYSHRPRFRKAPEKFISSKALPDGGPLLLYLPHFRRWRTGNNLHRRRQSLHRAFPLPESHEADNQKKNSQLVMPSGHFIQIYGAFLPPQYQIPKASSVSIRQAAFFLYT